MKNKTCYAYTRVSTVKQGDGVSLEAQRDAIAKFAARQGLQVLQWFEEKETAAKRGRPVFDAVVQSLQAGEADGLVVHKIDRSARNFSDWARIGELVDSGIEVHFAHESLDLRSRGGRLTADIQAVIAADYVRNLRQESIKGMEGRLKQGLFPWAAPIGYLNQGAGKPKAIDPARAPFVRQAFELYATGQYSQRGLLAELQQRGFRNKRGTPITKGCLENILSNPFYHGVVRLKRTGREYAGRHDPIIDCTLFERVQAMKTDRQIKKETAHNHPYRRSITCGYCRRSLIGERQKGHVYYRCQTKDCPTKSIREDVFEAAVAVKLQSLRLHEEDKLRLESKMEKWLQKRTAATDRRAVELQLSYVSNRFDRLTDALIDGLIDKQTFEQRKQRLNHERDKLQQALGEVGKIGSAAEIGRKYLELSKSLILNYGLGDRAQKARLVRIAFSNLELRGKNLCLEPQKWLQDTENTLGALCGAPLRDRTRTEELVEELVAVCSVESAPPISPKPKQQPDVPQWMYNLKNQKFVDFKDAA